MANFVIDKGTLKNFLFAVFLASLAFQSVGIGPVFAQEEKGFFEKAADELKRRNEELKPQCKSLQVFSQMDFDDKQWDYVDEGLICTDRISDSEIRKQKFKELVTSAATQLTSEQGIVVYKYKFTGAVNNILAPTGCEMIAIPQKIVGDYEVSSDIRLISGKHCVRVKARPSAISNLPLMKVRK